MPVFDGDEFDNAIDGSAGDDTINGLGGNDTLNGLGGIDILNGGEGDDILIAALGELVGGDAFNGGAGTDTLRVSGDGTTFTPIDFTGATLSSIERLEFADDGFYSFSQFLASQVGAGLSSTLEVVGSANSDEVFIFGATAIDLSGWTFTNWDALDRQVGDPTKDYVWVFGTGGADTITGSSQYDLLRGQSGNDTVNGGAGSDNIQGNAGDDVLNGDAGDDLLRGNTGVDTYDGGAGVDRISFFDLTATQGVVASILTQTIANDGFGNAETMTSIEDLGGGTAFVDDFTGDDNANFFIGDTGDVITARAGDDSFQISGAPGTINGGAGIDTITLFSSDRVVIDLVDNVHNIEETTNGVIVNLATGQILNDGFGGTGVLISIENAGGSAFDDQITGSNGANILTGYGGDDVLVGGAGDDTLYGENSEDPAATGNDTLNGGAGADRMEGGLGDDSYNVDNVGDRAIEALDAGFDTVRSTVDFALGLNVEDLILLGTALSGTGNTLDNTITGNALDNVLSGGNGNDELIGGAGLDNINGGNGDDQLSGGDSDDTIVGGAGNDSLDGGGGADTMSGGAGDDSYTVSDLGDLVNEGLNQGADVVFYNGVAGSYILRNNVENLVLLGSALNGTGNTLANTIEGNVLGNVLAGGAGDDVLIGADGADTLNGGVGADDLFGGAGNDTYVVDNVGDVVTEVGGGIDTVLSSIDFTLGGGLDNLTLSGAAIVANGNSAANTITGNAQANTINAGNGNDVVNGGGGNDTINAAAGNDTVDGGAGNDTITGLTGNDELIGAAGNDTLNGGVGADTLVGGAGADIFVFNAAAVVANADDVVDFDVVADTIQLENAIFLVGAAGALSAAVFVVGAGAGDADDRIVYDPATGALYYDRDGSGVATQVQFAQLDAGLALTAADFVVI